MSDKITLTAADITKLLSNTREKGGMERFLREFVASGDMYRVVNEAPQYSDKSKEQLVSIKNQMVAKAKVLELKTVKLAKKDGNVYIINTEHLVSE